ncbi:hypothetical protein C8T65DRAFT_106527 [Cerioporus squamosus]|nr:hypothetical protein C8T65DRAFT_106527 [Cerioporus squamosus]
MPFILASHFITMVCLSLHYHSYHLSSLRLSLSSSLRHRANNTPWTRIHSLRTSHLLSGTRGDRLAGSPRSIGTGAGTRGVRAGAEGSGSRSSHTGKGRKHDPSGAGGRRELALVEMVRGSWVVRPQAALLGGSPDLAVCAGLDAERPSVHRAVGVLGTAAW